MHYKVKNKLMKQTQTAESELQAALQSFMQSMPSAQAMAHSKKIKVTTVHPQTGQPMTVEMEQSSFAPTVASSATLSSHVNPTQAVAPQSILAQALPGASIIEKIIAGHISYIIIPVCGLVIAWSYNQMGGGHSALNFAIRFFVLSILLELTAKFMTFPLIEASLDKKLAAQRVRLKAKYWYREWIKTGFESIKASHIKKALQWSGIVFAFMACFIMLGYFLQGTGQVLSGGPSVLPYSANVTQDSFMVR